ncbi:MULTISPECIES: hypothetical protein [unclassified Brevundimonas]|uniref:hypothetical protein n=1 Tax=unclassified Brevundimonas TaxID=2622653 RepID=UPI001E5666CC|nr:MULTISPECIES: hypothetical protein [unclassified Brevundimonas]
MSPSPLNRRWTIGHSPKNDAPRLTPAWEAAIRLLMDWPAHGEAAALVLARPREARQARPISADWASRLAQRCPEAVDILAR